jgi:hypothetical protein
MTRALVFVFIGRLAEAVAGEAFKDFARGQRPYRADLLPMVEHGCCAPIINAAHLSGKLVDVARRVAGDKQLGLVAVPRQGQRSSRPSASVPSDKDKWLLSDFRVMGWVT